MKILCIYGCGGTGREIADLSHRIGKWQKIVFVDDHITGREVDEINVYSLDEVIEQFEKNDLEFIVSVGEPDARKALYEKLARLKLNYIKIIDPDFILSRFSSVARGTIIHRSRQDTVGLKEPHIQLRSPFVCLVPLMPCGSSCFGH